MLVLVLVAPQHSRFEDGATQSVEGGGTVIWGLCSLQGCRCTCKEVVLVDDLDLGQQVLHSQLQLALTGPAVLQSEEVKDGSNPGLVLHQRRHPVAVLVQAVHTCAASSTKSDEAHVS